jgi:hypothetical protein
MCLLLLLLLLGPAACCTTSAHSGNRPSGCVEWMDIGVQCYALKSLASIKTFRLPCSLPAAVARPGMWCLGLTVPELAACCCVLLCTRGQCSTCPTSTVEHASPIILLPGSCCIKKCSLVLLCCCLGPTCDACTCMRGQVFSNQHTHASSSMVQNMQYFC